MAQYRETIEIEMNQGVDIRDITAQVHSVVSRGGIDTGLVSIFVSGSTGSVTTIEYEPGAVSDLARAVNELAPPGRGYAHEEAWHDGNGHSHVQAALIGPGLVIPLERGRLLLGQWQQVVVINHDIRPRKRKVHVTVFNG